MSLEPCKLCNQDSTPWFHINGHICENCYYNSKRLDDLESRWINVKEKLPESPEKGCIEIIVASYSVEKQIFHISWAEFQKNNFYDRYNERMIIDDPYWPITHWMPLPEPPK